MGRKIDGLHNQINDVKYFLIDTPHLPKLLVPKTTCLMINSTLT